MSFIYIFGQFQNNMSPRKGATFFFILFVNQNVKSAIYGSSALIKIKGIEFR